MSYFQRRIKGTQPLALNPGKVPIRNKLTPGLLFLFKLYQKYFIFFFTVS